MISQILYLIKILPDSEKHIFNSDGKVWITNEWICGGFAGRAFIGDTEEDAARQLIDYLNEHIGHNSIVGSCVTKSGFPNLSKVKKYLESESSLNN